jgi:hypothetical protein
MSLQLAAQHLSHQGRGPDDTLVHMSKNELKSLSDLAMAHGGQLTINPQTGLPEAGMLDKLLPTIIGAGISYFTGIPAAQIGLGVGAFETVRTGSLQKGLMAGLGAYGGAGLTAGLMGAGEAAIGAEANAALAQNAAHTSLTPTGVGTDPGAAFGNQGFGNAALQSPAVAGASNFDKLSGGVSQLFKDPSKVMDSMGGGFNTIRNIGSAAAPLLGAEEVKANMPQTTTKPGKIRSYSYNPYGQTYTSTGDYEVPVTAADGGLMGMYGDYNSNQLNFAQRSEPVVRMASGGIPRYAGATDGSVVGATAPLPQTVEDLYTQILGRAPENQQVKDYWTNQLLGSGDTTISADDLSHFRNAAQGELANRPPAVQQPMFGSGIGGAVIGAINTANQTPAPPPAPTTGGQATSPQAAPAPISPGIQELYTSFLGRPADTDGASYWQNQFGSTIEPNEIAAFKTAATPERQVSDMYRNVLRRDPDQGGLQYWTSRLNAGEPPDKIYSEFLRIARGNPEIVTADETINKDFAAATTPYTGYRSTDQTNVADEWIRNTLGREPTAKDKEQPWYKNFNENKSVSGTEQLYRDFQTFAKTDAATTTAQKIKDATASLTARGVTEADVLRQTGKTIAQLVASDIDLTKGLASASQLLAPGTKAGFDFSSIRKPTTPQTNAPVGTTNPYGNATNPGDITRNPDGSTTITPNIPGRPYGGFSGMEQVRNAYTDGGGSLGYTPYAPKTMEEFNQLYNKQTGGSKQAYDYLTGKADYSATPYTKTGELIKPYVESVMGVPENTAVKKVLFDPATKKYKPNPDYVPITYNTLGEKVYGLSDREIIKRSTAGEDFAKESGVTYEQISKALNISIDEAKKRYPGLAASTTKTTEVAPEPFVYTGAGSGDGRAGWTKGMGSFKAAGGLADAYASGGMSHLGDYSDGGRLLRGPGDGVSDSIPAVIGRKQPARLADGEFVVPARIVSELGNGSTEAGARKLYAMMDRIQKARGKTVGKGKVAKNSRSEKYLPA